MVVKRPVEDIVDLLACVDPQVQKLLIEAMQEGLEEVPLPRVLTVKQVQQLRWKKWRKLKR